MPLPNPHKCITWAHLCPYSFPPTSKINQEECKGGKGWELITADLCETCLAFLHLFLLYKKRLRSSRVKTKWRAIISITHETFICLYYNICMSCMWDKSYRDPNLNPESTWRFQLEEIRMIHPCLTILAMRKLNSRKKKQVHTAPCAELEAKTPWLEGFIKVIQ